MDRIAKLFKSTKAAKWDRILFLDSGVRNMGFAFWEKLERKAGKPTPSNLILPDDSGLQKAPDNIDWLDAVDDHQTIWLEVYCRANRVHTVVIEYAELWGGSALSFASASKGDLFKLATLIGSLRHAAIQVTEQKPLLVGPRVWKSTMPKDVMVRRARRAARLARRRLVCDAHEIDAVAMGFAAQRLL